MYSYGLIGLGAANSLLLLRMEKEGVLAESSVVIFDHSFKAVNDKTYCFWAGAQDEVVKDLSNEIKHSWPKVISQHEQPEVLGYSRYYMVESLALYERTQRLIDKYPHNIRVVREEVEDIEEEGLFIRLISSNHLVEAITVYDSRPPEIDEVISTTVWQSFQGWKVQFDNPVFDPEVMRLMDFNIPQNDFTQFMYVLPVSNNEALVEVTRFGRAQFDEKLAADQLRNYLLTYNETYHVLDVERGVLPMSQNAEQYHRSTRVVSTGSRAGKLKSTTGYAFKNMYSHAKELVLNEPTKKATNPLFGMPSRGGGRFAFYDFVLLFILKFRPHWGKEIFTSLFRSKSTEEIFKFLDEKSTLRWEISMFAGLPVRKFLWSAFASSIAFMVSKPQRWVPVVFSLLALIINKFVPDYGTNLGIGLLIFFLFLVGIPHGALDGYSHTRKLPLLSFMARYIGIMGLVVLLWMFSPILGLALFLIYSAWHFGETDLIEWNRSNIALSLFWGTMLLGIILLSHLTEVNTVMSYMNIPSWDIHPTLASALVQAFIFVSIIGALWFRSAAWFISIVAISLGTQLPLALSFGIYFILQHSLTGWNHMRTTENWTHTGMFIKALPFTGGAIILFLVMFQFDRSSLWQWSSYFLIFLSALSLPHIYFMSRLYKEI